MIGVAISDIQDECGVTYKLSFCIDFSKDSWFSIRFFVRLHPLAIRQEVLHKFGAIGLMAQGFQSGKI
ncbi:MAG: hypothetical protein ABSH41_04705 [Syntrophobacteraceae bacterium]